MVTNTDVAALLPLLISIAALDTAEKTALAPATVDTVLVPLEEPDVHTTTDLTAAATRATALVADMVDTLPPPVPTVPAATLPPAVPTVPTATVPPAAPTVPAALTVRLPSAPLTVRLPSAPLTVDPKATDGEHHCFGETILLRYSLRH